MVVFLFSILLFSNLPNLVLILILTAPDGTLSQLYTPVLVYYQIQIRFFFFVELSMNDDLCVCTFPNEATPSIMTKEYASRGDSDNARCYIGKNAFFDEWSK